MDGDKHPNAIFKGSSMIFEERVEDFSSLPQADSNSTLEERSSLALRNILPTEDWVVRDERIIDAGVDLSIELKINSRYTNLRAQVQLKSTEHPRDNGDGSISLSVAVSNLKYLLNGQSPIYILYIANRDELRFVWARDERLRLDNDNPDWEEQKEVSLRFCNYVTPQTLLTIKERISKECRLMAQTHESLLKASSGDLVRVCIDTETLNSTDPNRLLTLILEQGISLVNSGHAIDVRKAIDGLNPSAVSLPRVQLVLGYVYYFQTKFVAALAALAEALIGQSQLSAEDRAFLKHLKNTCSYRLGQISYDEYMKRQEMLGEEATDAFKASILFDTLDKNLKSCTTTADRRLCVNHILEEVMQTSHNTKLSEILKIQIYSFWLQSEGFQICVEEHDRWAKVKMRQLMEQPVDIQRELTEATDEWLRWNAAISVGLERAVQLRHPLLIAEIRLTRACVSLLWIINPCVLANTFSTQEILPTNDQIQLILQDADISSRFFEEIGHLEGRLRAQSTKSESLVLIGEVEEARRIANEILPISQAMQYTDVEDRAQMVIEGKTLIEVARKNAVESENVDQDVRWADESDERMRLFAAKQLSNLNLPESRLAALERDAFSFREEARQRLSWCRHLELIQDKTHELRQETFYLYDPERFGICKKLGYKSQIGYTDSTTILNAFKKTYCESCSHRSPKMNE